MNLPNRHVILIVTSTGDVMGVMVIHIHVVKHTYRLSANASNCTYRSLTVTLPINVAVATILYYMGGGQGPVGIRGVYIHGQLHTRGFCLFMLK